MTLVITTCTNRKRKPIPDDLHVSALPQASIPDLADNWVRRLAAADDTFPAREIYGGRSFREATLAADSLGAQLMVISAGLGLISAGARVPPYACTVLVNAPDSIASRVVGDYSASGWWRALGAVSPYAQSFQQVAEETEGLVCAALSESYIEMIAGDLVALSAVALDRLRLFTRAPLDRVAPALRRFVMPYDDRLDGPDSLVRGTRGDFAGRALHHFAEHVVVDRDGRSPQEHAGAVSAALAGWRMAARFDRRRVGDAAVLDLIRDHWDDERGSTARSLAALARRSGDSLRAGALRRSCGPGARGAGMTARDYLKVRAVRSEQGEGTGVFAFFLYGSDINRIADISRIRRDEQELKGFQRREIRNHVKEITAFLDSGPVLFPNAIILAMSPEVEFARSRGRSPDQACNVGETGTLKIPLYPEGHRAAWIVDGQQRSLALGAAKDGSIAVPVVGFISDELTIQREQFILVNKARKLPTGLINELLPEVSVLLPRNLAQHAANHLGGEAQIPPPAYDPQLVADAILTCAEKPRRDITVGGVGRAQVLFAEHFPALFEKLAPAAMKKLTDPAKQQPAPSNLFEGEHAGEERSGEQAPLKTSVYTAAALRPGAVALGVGGLALAIGALVVGRRRRD